MSYYYYFINEVINVDKVGKNFASVHKYIVKILASVETCDKINLRQVFLIVLQSLIHM